MSPDPDPANFLARFRQLAQSHGWTTVVSPFQLVDRWEALVADAVDAIDARFRAARRDDVEIGRQGSPWWQRCVPKATSGELAEDLQRLYGIGPTTGVDES